MFGDGGLLNSPTELVVRDGLSSQGGPTSASSSLAMRQRRITNVATETEAMGREREPSVLAWEGDADARQMPHLASRLCALKFRGRFTRSCCFVGRVEEAEQNIYSSLLETTLR